MTLADLRAHEQDIEEGLRALDLDDFRNMSAEGVNHENQQLEPIDNASFAKMLFGSAMPNGQNGSDAELQFDSQVLQLNLAVFGSAGKDALDEDVNSLQMALSLEAETQNQQQPAAQDNEQMLAR